jgi:hypothetical protein
VSALRSVDVAQEFGDGGTKLIDTISAIEKTVIARGWQHPTKFEASASTLYELRKIGDRLRDERMHPDYGPLMPPKGAAVATMMAGSAPVWVDPNMPHGVVRVYWVEDDVDRLAEHLRTVPLTF